MNYMIGRTILMLLQIVFTFLCFVGIIVGIIYIIRSKKTTLKKTLIGLAIIIVPFILRWIVTIINLRMSLNMQF